MRFDNLATKLPSKTAESKMPKMVVPSSSLRLRSIYVKAIGGKVPGVPSSMTITKVKMPKEM